MPGLKSTTASEQSLLGTVLPPVDTLLELRFTQDPESPGMTWPEVGGDAIGRRFISITDLEDEDFERDLCSPQSSYESHSSLFSPTPASLRYPNTPVVDCSTHPSLLTPALQTGISSIAGLGSLVSVRWPPPVVQPAPKTVLDPHQATKTLSEGGPPGQEGALSRNHSSAWLFAMNTWLALLLSITERMEREMDDTKQLVTIIETLELGSDYELQDICGGNEDITGEDQGVAMPLNHISTSTTANSPPLRHRCRSELQHLGPQPESRRPRSTR